MYSVQPQRKLSIFVDFIFCEKSIYILNGAVFSASVLILDNTVWMRVHFKHELRWNRRVVPRL